MSERDITRVGGQPETTVSREEVDYLYSFILGHGYEVVRSPSTGEHHALPMDCVRAHKAFDALTAERDDAIHGRDLARLDTEREREAVRALTAERDRLREALKTARTWLARPSDLPAQHAESLIRATHEIDEILARTEADG